MLFHVPHRRFSGKNKEIWLQLVNNSQKSNQRHHYYHTWELQSLSGWAKIVMFIKPEINKTEDKVGGGPFSEILYLYVYLRLQ